jgi:hypothetical protein
MSARILTGAAVLVDPATSHAAIESLFAQQPSRPTISVGAALFPETIPGYNQELGLTLPTVAQLGPASQGLGLRAGPALILPGLAEDTRYDSNVLGVRHGPGSQIVETAPSVTLDADYSRARVGAFVGLDNSEYFQTKNQSHTDFKAALGGSAAIGRGEATLAYSHLSLHDDPTAIGAIPSSTPTPFTLDDIRASFDLAMGRAALRPFVDASRWSYGQSDVGGVQTSQAYRDRDVLQAGLAGRFNLGERRDVLATVSVNRNDYLNSSAASPAPSSTDVLALGGLDYELNGAFRLRLMAGLQARQFDKRVFQSRVAAVGQFSAIWTPQRTTTVTLTVARSLEDLAQEDTGGTIYTRAEVEVSHELKRDLVLRTRVGVQSAQFLQVGGTQAQIYGKTGFEWTVNRYVKMLGDIQAQRSSSPIDTGLTGPASGPYTRAVAHLGFTVAI